MNIQYFFKVLWKVMEPETGIVKLFHKVVTSKIDFQVLPRIKLAHYKWSEEMANEDIQKCKQIVEEAATKATNQVEVLQNLMPYIIDCLFLKSAVFSVYSQIKLQCKKIDEDEIIYPTLINMSFSDFIIILLKMIEQKEIIGNLLSMIQVPLPIFFMINNQSVNMPEMLKDIMSTNKMSLILNCSSEKARQQWKTTFIFQLFDLPKNYQYETNDLYKDSLYVHWFFPGNRISLLADFNGSFESMPKNISLLHKKCGLIIIHILQQELFLQEKYNGDEYFLAQKELFAHPEKVILIVRIQKKSTKKLKPSQVLDSLGDAKNKSFVFCLKSESCEEIAEKIKQKKMFQLQKAVNYFDILNDQSKSQNLKKDYQEAEKIIQMLPSSTQDLFPHIFISNKIALLNNILLKKQIEYNSIDHLNKIVKFQEIQQIKSQIFNLEEEIVKGRELSQFVKRGFNILIRGIQQPDHIQVFSTKMSLWKKNMKTKLNNQSIKISKDIQECQPNQQEKKKHLMNKAEQIEQSIDKYDISLTTILNDVITKLSYSDQKDLIQQQKKSRDQIKATIQSYYNISYKSMFPINLVDGKNLLFGNKYLKKFCKNLSLNKRFLNKKVYIISIIGNQSSGKSTLLNYLFRCQFETAPGRCTKGMYFNICEFEDKVIWLIDTEGLLSISARDQVFDHKIATFVLSISDIVIINNKGELTSQLLNMIKICLFAMKYLKRKDTAQHFKPQKLLFVLRDQEMPKQGENFQEQMISKIIFELEKLKEALNLDYKDYLDLQTQNIFSFPSIFNETKVKKLGSMQSYTETFGRCIVGLRSRIMSILGNEGRILISDCYDQAELCWQTILKCGSDLMNYQTIEELTQKQFILKEYTNLLPKYIQLLRQALDSLYGSLTQNINFESLIQKQEQIRKYLIQISKEKASIFLKQLRRNCATTCSRDSWYIVCNHKISTFCTIYQNEYMERLSNLKISLQQDKQLASLCGKVEKDVKQLILKNISEEKLYQSLNEMKDKILRLYDEQQEKINPLNIELDIAHVFQNGLEKSQPYEKVSTIGTTWLSEFKKFKSSQKYSSMYVESQHHQTTALILQLQTELFEKLLKKIRESSKTHSAFKEIKEIQDMALNLQEEIKSSHSQIQKQLQQERPDKDVKLLAYDNVRIRDVLRGCLIYNIAEVFINKKKLLVEQKRLKSKTSIQNYFEKVKAAFKKKNDSKQISFRWIKEIVQFYQNKLKNNCKQKIEFAIRTSSKFLNPSTITDQAYLKTFKQGTAGKKKWIECLKLIVDPNRYLFEILCQKSWIKNRKDLCSQTLRQQKKNIVKLFESQCKKGLQNIELEPENSLKIQNYKSKYNLIQISGFSDNQILILMSQCFSDIEFYNKQIQLIQTHVTTYQLNLDLEKFINTTLRDIVIGCPITCPFCGAKCTQQGSHSQHKINQDYHLLPCFRGATWKNLSTPCYFSCSDKYYASNSDIMFDQKTIEYLKSSQFSFLSSRAEKQRCVEVWMNVRTLLREHLFKTKQRNSDGNFRQKDMRFDHVYERHYRFDKFLKDPLQNKDLTNTYFIDLQGKKQALLSYFNEKTILVDYLLPDFIMCCAKTISVQKFSQKQGDGQVKYRFQTSFYQHGWQLEQKNIFFILGDENPYAVPIYQLSSDYGGLKYHWTTDPNFNFGWSYDRIVGKAYLNQIGSSIPIYSYHTEYLHLKNKGWDYLLTKKQEDLHQMNKKFKKGDGWHKDGIAFYALPY